MGKNTEDIIFAFFKGIDEENLQHGEVQVEEHIKDPTPYQHPNDVGMDIGWRNLGVMNELFENRWKGKAELCVELLLGEVNDVVSDFLCGHGIPFH